MAPPERSHAGVRFLLSGVLPESKARKNEVADSKKVAVPSDPYNDIYIYIYICVVYIILHTYTAIHTCKDTDVGEGIHIPISIYYTRSRVWAFDSRLNLIYRARNGTWVSSGRKTTV